MNVVFEDEALDDLRRIFDWIAEVNRPAAEKLVGRLFDRAESLAARSSPIQGVQAWTLAPAS